MTQGEPVKAISKILCILQYDRNLLLNPVKEFLVVRPLPVPLEPKSDLAQTDAFWVGASSEHAPQLYMCRLTLPERESVLRRSIQGNVVNVVISPAERTSKACFILLALGKFTGQS